MSEVKDGDASHLRTGWYYSCARKKKKRVEEESIIVSCLIHRLPVKGMLLQSTSVASTSCGITNHLKSSVTVSSSAVAGTSRLEISMPCTNSITRFWIDFNSSGLVFTFHVVRKSCVGIVSVPESTWKSWRDIILTFVLAMFPYSYLAVLKSYLLGEGRNRAQKMVYIRSLL